MSTDNLYIRTNGTYGDQISVRNADTHAAIGPGYLATTIFGGQQYFGVTPNGNYIAVSESSTIVLSALDIFDSSTLALTHQMFRSVLFPGLTLIGTGTPVATNTHVYVAGWTATTIYVAVFNLGTMTVQSLITVGSVTGSSGYFVQPWATRTTNGSYVYMGFQAQTGGSPDIVSYLTVCIANSTQTISSTNPVYMSDLRSSSDSSRLYGITSNGYITVFAAGSATPTLHPIGTAAQFLTSSNDDSAVYVIDIVSTVKAIRTYSTVTWTAINATAALPTTVYRNSGAPPNGNSPYVYIGLYTPFFRGYYTFDNHGNIVHTVTSVYEPATSALSRTGNTLTAASPAFDEGFQMLDTTTWATVFQGASGSGSYLQLYTDTAQSTQAGAVVAASFTGTAVGAWTNGTATLTTTYTATAVATVTSRLTNSIVMIV